MKKILSLLLIVFVCVSCIKVSASEPPKESELYAKSAVLMDADSGRILYAKNGEEAMANASTTKILTCILALENCSLDSVVTVSSYAVSQPKVRLGMREGQQFYLKDLLYALMLESFNDCAVAIAEYIAGTTEGFAALMNGKAGEIGCKDSYFITPNGLDAQNGNGFHHTTASDLALIMRYCIRQSPKTAEFLTITQAGNHFFTDIEGKRNYTCVNHNAFLSMMDGALSGKTGFTGNAGYCYVGALTRDERTYIVALLACGWPNNKAYKWSDTKKLMNYGIDNYFKRRLSDIPIDETYLSPIAVEDGQGDHIGETVYLTPVLQEEAGVGEILALDGEDISVTYEIENKLAAPVEAGTCIGRITYRLGDEVLKEYSVVLPEGSGKIDFDWCFLRVKELLLL